MKECNKYIGLDVHKETIAVSVAEANGGEVPGSSHSNIMKGVSFEFPTFSF